MLRSGIDQLALVAGQRRDLVGAATQQPHRAAAPVHGHQLARRQIAEIDRQRMAGRRLRPRHRVAGHAQRGPQRAKATRQINAPALNAGNAIFAHGTVTNLRSACPTTGKLADRATASAETRGDPRN